MDTTTQTAVVDGIIDSFTTKIDGRLYFENMDREALANALREARTAGIADAGGTDGALSDPYFQSDIIDRAIKSLFGRAGGEIKPSDASDALMDAYEWGFVGVEEAREAAGDDVRLAA